MLVAGLSVTSLPWRSELSELKERLACVFQRSETREQVGLYLDGLVGGVERKNGWQLAEHAGDDVPWRMQAVVGRGFWGADFARGMCRGYGMRGVADADAAFFLCGDGLL